MLVPPAEPSFGYQESWGLHKPPRATRVTPVPQKGASMDLQPLGDRASPRVRPGELVATSHPLASTQQSRQHILLWRQEPQLQHGGITPSEDDSSLSLLPLSSGPGTPTQPTALGIRGHQDRQSMQPEHGDGTGTGMARSWTTGTGTAHGTGLLAHGTRHAGSPGRAQHRSVPLSRRRWPCWAMPRAHGRTTHQPQGPEDVALPGLPRPSRAERSRERKKEEEEAKAAVGRGPGPAPGSREGTKAKRG